MDQRSDPHRSLNLLATRHLMTVIFILRV